MLFRWLGGSCTGGANRCKAKQGRREEGADVWILTSNLVRFLGRVQSKKNNFGSHSGVPLLNIAQGSDRRLAMHSPRIRPRSRAKRMRAVPIVSSAMLEW